VAAAALDPSVHLTLLDGKHVELIAWSDVADEFVGADQEAAVAALEDLREVMDDRYAVLASNRRRKMTSSDLEGLHVLVIDELLSTCVGVRKRCATASGNCSATSSRADEQPASLWWRPRKSRVTRSCPRGFVISFRFA